jgi:hypothetical protein
VRRRHRILGQASRNPLRNFAQAWRVKQKGRPEEASK